MSKKIIRISAIIVLLLVVLLIMVWRPQPKLPQSISIDTHNQPTLGNPQAKIHIVAFEDLKCFNCKRYNNQLFPVIKQKYIDTGKVKYTFINLAFIDGSLPAALAARCLYAQKNQYFFDFVDYIYRHQPPESDNWATVPALMEFASHVSGANMNQFGQCLIENPYAALINANFNMAAKIMNGNIATPTLYVNGRPVNPLTLKQIEYLIKKS